MSLPSGLEKPLQRFYEYLRSERELSLHTQQNYKRQLTTMAEQLVSLGVDNWQAVDAGWVRQLALYCAQMLALEEFLLWTVILISETQSIVLMKDHLKSIVIAMPAKRIASRLPPRPTPCCP